MSHEFESGVFTNSEGAWHGLGTVVEDKLYDIQEALTLADLDWTVSKKPLSYLEEENDISKKYYEMPGYYSVVRDTDGTVLNPCVSETYDVLQNSEAFAFFEPFVHDKDCFISAAIALNGGKKVCMTARIEDNLREIVPGDTVEAYLLVATSHDGSLRTTTKFCHERTVCANTLRSAMAEKGAFRCIKHTKTQRENLAEVAASINLFRRDFDEQVSIYKQLADKRMDLDSTRNYLETLFAKELKESAERLDIAKDEMRLEDMRFTKKCLENYCFTPDLQLDKVEGTAWAAFNAVTEAIKTRSNNLDNRLNSIWFGPDSKLIEKAKTLALSI